MYKLYCIIINARLSKWDAEHSILEDNQNGFRKSRSTIVYADNVVLIAENEEELQQMLNKLNLWCENNKLEVNINKSKVIHFRNRSKQGTNRIF